MMRVSFSGRQRVMLVTPVVLIATMYVAFQTWTARLGFPAGYLAAFALYWIGWCVGLPVAVLGCRRVKRLIDPRFAPEGHFNLRLVAALSWPIAFPLFFAFVPRIALATAPIIAVSVVLGVVTGVSEELLWRGVYVTLFPDNRWLSLVYPSLMFGLWHLCPLAVLPSRYPGGVASFATYSILLGLSYAYAARRTRSIFWCTISHAVHDSLGLAGFLYATWLS